MRREAALIGTGARFQAGIPGRLMGQRKSGLIKTDTLNEAFRRFWISLERR